MHTLQVVNIHLPNSQGLQGFLCLAGGGGSGPEEAAGHNGVMSTCDALVSILPADIPTQPAMMPVGRPTHYQIQVGIGGARGGAVMVTLMSVFWEASGTGIQNRSIVSSNTQLLGSPHAAAPSCAKRDFNATKHNSSTARSNTRLLVSRMLLSHLVQSVNFKSVPACALEAHAVVFYIATATATARTHSQCVAVSP